MVAKQVYASRYYISWLDLWWGLWIWCSRSRRIWKRIYTFPNNAMFLCIYMKWPFNRTLTHYASSISQNFLPEKNQERCWEHWLLRQNVHAPVHEEHRHEAHSHIPIACFMVTVQRSVHVILLSPSRSSTHFSPALTKRLGSSATATHPQVIQQLLRKDNNAEQWPEEQQKKGNQRGRVFFPFNFSQLHLHAEWEPDVWLWRSCEEEEERKACTGSKHPHRNLNTDLQDIKQSHLSGC